MSDSDDLGALLENVNSLRSTFMDPTPPRMEMEGRRWIDNSGEGPAVERVYECGEWRPVRFVPADDTGLVSSRSWQRAATERLSAPPQ